MTGPILVRNQESEKEVLSRRTKVILLGITVLGAALRLYHLGEESLWYDETASVAFGRHVGLTLAIFDFDILAEAPLQAILVHVWQRVIGIFADLPVTSPRSDFVLRLLPCFFSIATIPLVFFVARRMLQDGAAALIAAFLFAICPLHLYYAQELRIYSALVLIAMCAMYFVFRALEENRHRHWAAMTFFFALLLYTHFISVWIIFAFNVVFVLLCIHPKYRAMLWRWFAYNLVMLFLILPPLITIWKLYKAMHQVNYSWFPATDLKTGFLTFKTLFAGYGFNPLLGSWFYHALLLFALALTAYGLFSLRKKPLPCLLLGGAVIIPIGGNVLYYMTRELCFYEHRHFIFSGIAAIMLVARGIRALPRPTHRCAAALLFVALTLPSIADFYARRMHPLVTHRMGVFERVDFRAPTSYLDEHWRDGDLLAHSSTFTSLSMQHYFPVPQKILGGEWLQVTGNTKILRMYGIEPNDPEKATTDAERVWLIAVSPEKITFADPTQAAFVVEWLDEHFALVERQTFDGMTLSLYERKPAPALASEGDIG